MASFDFVDSSSKAYRFVWLRRADVLRLSAMALSLKILSFVAFVAFDIQSDILRQGLYLLPVYLLEGWVIARLMTMAVYSEAQENTKSFLPPAEDIERNIKASMIVYVLTKLLLSFVIGASFPDGALLQDSSTPPEPGFYTFILAIMMLVFLIWSFRFIWIYVPYVMGVRPFEYMKRFQAFSASFYMLGVWVLCFVPIVMLMVLSSKLLGLFMLGIGFDPDSVAFDAGLSVLHAIIDYVMSLVSSLGIAYGIYSVFNNEDKTTSLF